MMTSRDDFPDIQAALLQYQAISNIVDTYTAEGANKFELTTDLILYLHSVGTPTSAPAKLAVFRSDEVHIVNSVHAPPKSTSIPELVSDMCSYVNSNFHPEKIFHLSAFVLWRLNWIHPFLDRNGRTARAICYMLISILAGGILPGTRTLPELLREHRDEYYDALRKADKAFLETSAYDVSEMEELISEMLFMQLNGFAALNDFSENRIGEIVASRLGAARESAVGLVFRHQMFSSKTWALNDIVVVQVGARKDIGTCSENLKLYSDPFPGLFLGKSSEATLSINTKNSGRIFSGSFQLDQGGRVFELSAGSSLIVESPGILNSDNALAWSIAGALYALRLPEGASDARIVDAFEILAARHVDDLERRSAYL